ncbi:MAG TPA: cytochrome c3 family protein [Vicinamibacterales bacterium]|nr:cytochrome c3 family protein [Vicinamibacterales bacterium]
MSDRFRSYSHLIRMAALFVCGIAVFLVGRSLFVPSDFGVHGHYRAGALDAARVRPITFAGQAACVECHGDIGDLRKTARHARVACESCHGPLATHAAGEEPRRPAPPDGQVTCIGCHLKNRSKPAAFPQIEVADHAGDNKCIECHNPHAPKIS